MYAARCSVFKAPCGVCFSWWYLLTKAVPLELSGFVNFDTCVPDGVPEAEEHRSARKNHQIPVFLENAVGLDTAFVVFC
jgi:hypothetical protein